MATILSIISFHSFIHNYVTVAITNGRMQWSKFSYELSKLRLSRSHCILRATRFCINSKVSLDFIEKLI